jgi:DNA-binding winged helix-turn-helix (wHTH) protein
VTREPGLVHQFGEFRLDAGSRRLWRGQQKVLLGQKATDALVRLLERPGEVVGKDELIRLLWPDTVVEENNLNQQISALVTGARALTWQTIAISTERMQRGSRNWNRKTRTCGNRPKSSVSSPSG